MEPIDRRRFLGATVGSAALLSTTGGLRADETSAQSTGTPPPPPMVDLPGTGIRMSRLGQGTGVKGWSRQSNQTRMGFKDFVALIRHAHDRGIRFFDLADLYGTHIYFREALKSFDRDKLAILTKVWWRYDGPEGQTGAPSRADAARSTLERFRHEIITDYLDIVLLHCLTSPTWNRDMQPYMDVLSEEKEKGRIKAVGVSCHDLDALKLAVATPWVEVILARINPRGAVMDGSPDDVVPVLQKARENGKAIIGMKIFGEGRLVGERENCVKYVQELGLLDAMTIGFQSAHEIDDMLHLMHRFPARAVA